MIYYRLASQKRRSQEWEWLSPVLSSLEAVFRLRQRYSSLDPTQMRVFLASSTAYMDVLLVRENLGLSSNSLTMEELLNDPANVTPVHIREFEKELGWPEATEAAALPAPVAAQEPETPAETEQQVEAEQRVESVAVLVPEDPEPGGGDHDELYTFTFPHFLPELQSWMRLRERVLAGELSS